MARVIAAKVVRLAEAKGWNQAALVAQSKVAASNVHRCWNGIRQPNLADALRLARALDVPLDYLADDAMAEPPARPTYEQEWVLRLLKRVGFDKIQDRLMAFDLPDGEVRVGARPGGREHPSGTTTSAGRDADGDARGHSA